MKRVTLLLTAISLLFGLFAGTIGGLFAFDSRMDGKIERVMTPIAKDVREIRSLLNQMLLRQRGG